MSLHYAPGRMVYVVYRKDIVLKIPALLVCLFLGLGWQDISQDTMYDDSWLFLP